MAKMYGKRTKKEYLEFQDSFELDPVQYLSFNGDYSGLKNEMHYRYKYISETKVKVDKALALRKQRELCYRAYAACLSGKGQTVDPDVINAIKNSIGDL